MTTEKKSRFTVISNTDFKINTLYIYKRYLYKRGIYDYRKEK